MKLILLVVYYCIRTEITNDFGKLVGFFKVLWSLSLAFRSQTAHHQPRWHYQCIRSCIYGSTAPDLTLTPNMR